jgi:hypothetical protein
VKKVLRTLSLGEFVEAYGGRYSEVLGVRLSGGDDGEVFKWFLASLLFGAPITESAAVKTYRCFVQHGVLTAEKIVRTGWEGLVEILDEGGYTRYDFKTADKLLMVAKSLVEAYAGSLSRLHASSSDSRDLERRLKGLGKGVGDVTVSIFLRELRDVWEKADARPTGLEVLAGEQLGILKTGVGSEEALKMLKRYWARNGVGGKSFVHFETALLRLGRECRKGGCDVRLTGRV